MMNMAFLTRLLIFLQHFGIHIERWSLIWFIYNVPKIHGCQQHFDFEVPFIELSNDSSGLALKRCHCMLRYTLKSLKLVFHGLQSTQPKLKDGLLDSKYVFALQCNTNMLIWFQMELLVCKMLDLLHLKFDILFFVRVVKTLKSFKQFLFHPKYLTFSNTWILYLLFFKRGIKTLKSFKQYLFQFKCLTISNTSS